MKMLRPVLRRLFPKQYAKIMLDRAEAARKRITKSKNSFSQTDLHHHIAKIDEEISDLQEWLQEIADEKLLYRASKMGIYIDDIPLPIIVGDWKDKHFEIGKSGNTYLHHETRNAIHKKIREEMPKYRKERRDTVEFYVKVVTFISGLIGTATGFLAVALK